MKMPGTAYSDALLGQDPQPYHMDFYVNTTDDNGGVHINSGIPNHAFYLYCMLYGRQVLGGAGAGLVRALQQLNNPFASFHDWAVADGAGGDRAARVRQPRGDGAAAGLDAGRDLGLTHGRAWRRGAWR